MNKQNLSIELQMCIREALQSGDAVKIHGCIDKVKDNLPLLGNDQEAIPNLLGLYRLLEFEGRNDEALDCLEKVSQVSADDMYLQSKLLRETGLCHMRMNQKGKGLDALQRALNIAKDNNNHQEIIVTSLFLGKYYFAEKDWTQSLEYFNDQIKHARIIHDIPNEAEGYLWIGSVFYQQKQYNLALDNWRTAEELAVDSHHLPLIYRTGIKRCKVYLEMNKIKLAKEIISSLSTL